MSIRRCFSRTSFVFSVVLLATARPVGAATASDSERLEKLEREPPRPVRSGHGERGSVGR
jgi:hypothetical protein